MVDGFEHLQRLGVQKIHEATHISVKNVELIMGKSFDKLNKIQFMGFLSILEREYAIDLSALRKEYLAVTAPAENEDALPYEITPVGSEEKRINQWTVMGIIGVILLIIMIAYLAMQKEEKPEQKVELNSSLVEEVKIQREMNQTAAPEESAPVVEEPVVVKRLLITPKVDVWVGIIDLETYKRSSKLTGEPFELDPEKSWLLLFGHGNIKVESSDVMHDFSARERLYFSYEDGILEQLDEAEYIVKNRGSAW